MDDKRLTITEHLEELRQRLIKAMIAVAICTTGSFFFAKQVFFILLRPVPGIQPVFTQVTEMLGTYMRVALLTGLIISMPFLVYQGIMFVAPGLTPKERRYLYLMLPGITLSFLAGVVFSYFVLLPAALNFLITFGQDIATPLIKIDNYVSVVTRLLFWVGVIFETPLVIFFLARIGMVSPRLLSQYRKYAYVVAFVLAAVITPTIDPVNQTLVAGPLIALYEVGILLSKIAYRRRQSPSVTTEAPQPR